MIGSKEVQEVRTYLANLQNDLCEQFSEEEGEAQFIKDSWDYKTGGGGCTRVLKEGAVIEQGGVNFSYILGENLPASGNDNFKNLQGYRFQAMGVSSVIHPRNPYVPTAHLNVRFFLAEKDNCQPVWWFGGGFDLTPYYPFESDCIDWHRTAKKSL